MTYLEQVPMCRGAECLHACHHLDLPSGVTYVGVLLWGSPLIDNLDDLLSAILMNSKIWHVVGVRTTCNIKA